MMNIKRLAAAFVLTLAAVSAAFAIPAPWVPLLWQTSGVHDGISLDFANQRYYTKAPGAAARVAPFTDIFTFTRNSTSTFLGQSGFLEYANENLNLQAQTLEDAAWSLGNATVSVNNTTAPDGTATAEKIVEAATLTSHVIGQIRTLTANATYTASIYVKAAGRTRAQIFFGKSGSPFTRGCVDVNLTTGAQNASCDVNSPAFTANRTVTDAGNGWWRISISVRPDTTSTDWYLEVRMHDGTSTTYTGDGTSGLFVWGGQIQRGLRVGPYLPTIASPKYDQPRLEYQVSTRGTNYLLQSQSVNVSWTVSGATISADAASAPDSTVTADKIVESSGGTFHLARQDTSLIAVGRTNTFSTYLQASGRGFARVQFTDTSESNGCFVDVNLSSGATGTVTAIGTGASQAATVTPVSSYYRVALTCSISTTATTGRAQILLANALGTVSFSGDGASGVNVWGNQVEPGSVATDYAVTTTTAPGFINTNPVPLGLLSEAARTNVALRDQDLDNASWTKSNASISADFGTAPDGTVSSDKIVEDGATAIHGVISGVTVVAGGTYTLSAYVRPAGRTFVFMYGINVDQYGAIFDLANLTTANIVSGVGSVTAKGIDRLPNGVYRVWVSGIMNGSATTLNFVGGPAISLSVPGGYTYLGDSVSGVEMWGIQIEAGAHPTSYLATASTSTARSGDLAVATGISPWFSIPGGTLCASYDTKYAVTGGNQFMARFSDNTSNNHFSLMLSGTGTAQLSTASGGVFDGLATAVGGAVTADTRINHCGAWATNDVASVRDGNAVGADTSATMPTAITQMELGSDHIGTNRSDSLHILKVDHYPTRKANGALVPWAASGVFR